MSERLRRGLFAGVLLALASCLDAYQPPEVKANVQILVVDGFINATNNSAHVKLTYAAALTSDTPPPAATNASVSIQDQDGEDFVLSGDGKGTYSTDNMTVDKSKKYRLHGVTSDNFEFTSDYITITETPPIDSITWRSEKNSVALFANTHDIDKASRYYQWNYTETWEYVASFYSTYKMADGEAVERPLNDRIWACWSEEKSSGILLGSTVKLSDDVIRDSPLTTIPGNSIKLSRRYSILVAQRTLTQEAYEFWLELRKTTESLGGLFDPLPAQVLGNIHSVPDTPGSILGYFSGGTISEKRIFIRYQELPDELLAMREKAPCQDDDVKSIPLADIPQTTNDVLLIDPIYVSGVGIVGYTTALQRCIDCRLQGGITQPPDYW